VIEKYENIFNSWCFSSIFFVSVSYRDVHGNSSYLYTISFYLCLVEHQLHWSIDWSVQWDDFIFRIYLEMQTTFASLYYAYIHQKIHLNKKYNALGRSNKNVKNILFALFIAIIIYLTIFHSIVTLIVCIGIYYFFVDARINCFPLIGYIDTAYLSR